MRRSKPTIEFGRDIQRMKKRGYDMTKLEKLLDDLIEGRQLSPLRRDHLLKGEWAGCRDCHVSGDWVLIYRIEPLPSNEKVPAGPVEIVMFIRTGTHADIFSS